ncbi:hypothetical protein BC834DRAFT_973597 [Gloeopeniophorella convolvens]|nr:hypothetical protein BC834DRAFT_973597 [Gloeopeniophorella convolvens]
MAPSQATATASANTRPGYKEKSDYELTKDFGGFRQFMCAYGLKPYDHNDVLDAKSILDDLRKQELEEVMECADSRNNEHAKEVDQVGDLVQAHDLEHAGNCVRMNCGEMEEYETGKGDGREGYEQEFLIPTVFDASTTSGSADAEGPRAW